MAEGDAAPARRLGMPWYRREAYPQIRAAMADGEKMAATYDQWLISAEQVEETLRGTGLDVVRVEIAQPAFAEWCRRTERRPDGAARAAYAEDHAAQAS